ncbi:unnamed protein product [Tenebrio molitor]|nr:unnamed protein product [Tenebrio molitor]
METYSTSTYLIYGFLCSNLFPVEIVCCENCIFYLYTGCPKIHGTTQWGNINSC